MARPVAPVDPRTLGIGEADSPAHLDQAPWPPKLAGTTQVLLPLAPDWRSPAAALSDRALYFDRNDHPCVLPSVHHLAYNPMSDL